MPKVVLVSYELDDGEIYFIPARLVKVRAVQDGHVVIQTLFPKRGRLTKQDLQDIHDGRLSLPLPSILFHVTSEVRVQDVSPAFGSIAYMGISTITQPTIQCLGMYCGDKKALPFNVDSLRVQKQIKKDTCINFVYYEHDEARKFTFESEDDMGS